MLRGRHNFLSQNAINHCTVCFLIMAAPLCQPVNWLYNSDEPEDRIKTCCAHVKSHDMQRNVHKFLVINRSIIRIYVCIWCCIIYCIYINASEITWSISFLHVAKLQSQGMSMNCRKRWRIWNHRIRYRQEPTADPPRAFMERVDKVPLTYNVHPWKLTAGT